MTARQLKSRQLKSRQLKRWEFDGVSGAVVVIDVISTRRCGSRTDTPACWRWERTTASAPADIELAAHVDAFDFAMEVVRDERGLRLEPTRP